MSYANMDGVPTQTAGTSEILASDWNTYVRDNFDSIKSGHVVCTSSTRPTGIQEGTMVYETDTNLIYVYTGSDWKQNNLTPVGMISPFAGSSSPEGWLICDGAAVSRTTYAVLFGLIGSTYGSGDGSTTFNVPDLRGRVAVGLGTNADVNALNDSDGASVGDRRPKHKHTVTDPGHTHTVTGKVSNDDVTPDGSTADTAFAGTAFFGQAHTVTTNTTGITVGPQSNVPTDGPAYLTVNYIIKV